MFKKIKVTGTELVVQDNKLIDSPRMLSLQEQKLFLFLVSKLDPKNPEDIIFRVPINEFAKAIGVDSLSDIYRDVRKVAKQLMSRIVSIKKMENDRTVSIVDTHIVSYAEYWIGKGYTDIKISEEIVPYLFDLKREYTTYKLSQVTRLSSVYAIRLYEMLKKQERIGNRTFFVDDLREKLSIGNTQYKRFSDFKQYVLEIAKREINDKTDIKIDFRLIKTARKITAIQFDIFSKNEHMEEAKKLYAICTEKNKIRHLNEVMNFGFSKKSATSMIGDLFDSDIENAIAAVKNQIAKGNVKNPKAMLRIALKEKWSMEKIDYGKLGKSKKLNEEPPKIPQNKSTFMKVFDSLFKR
jgi:plasmid replication initiation protein